MRYAYYGNGRSMYLAACDTVNFWYVSYIPLDLLYYMC